MPYTDAIPTLHRRQTDRAFLAPNHLKQGVYLPATFAQPLCNVRPVNPAATEFVPRAMLRRIGEGKDTMTPEQRQQIVQSRTADYNNIMRTTLFTFLGIGAFLHLGDGSYSAPLLVLSIVISAYGILAGGTALDDLIALRDDMDEAMSGTNYGGVVGARDIPMLKNISSACIGLTGLACVLSILL